MFCEICRKKISVRKHLFNIFKVDTHHICESCYQKYPLIPKRSIIPIKEGVMIWQSLIQTNDDISSLAHMSFYKPYIIDYMNNYNTHVLLIDDYFNDNLFKIYDIFELGDIYFLTLYDKIK
jgi:hypothetical protein